VRGAPRAQSSLRSWRSHRGHCPCSRHDGCDPQRGSLSAHRRGRS